ncbi:uncharacterized protein LOC124431394 [Vespa crabro]|uniref:uncharacterized protein LOC124431394 n=1 Tax=Vespa crabro TaxID=7445 RepID=UPI001EFFC760|nr:uncharacterized protein LOC124431394 [Vespa crabro]XP_046835218.1 uncharacterized protein LOC124431394 [Vespa crabro]
MILLTKPELKYLDKNKIHVSRRPKFLTWIIFVLYTILFIWICYHVTKNIFFLIVSILGEITFCLDALGEWEDLILNKETNKAIISRYTWSDKLCYKFLNKQSILMELDDIRYVGVSIELGLFIVHKNGNIVSINMNGLTRKEIQILRKEINYFLNMSRIQCLDCFPSDPYDQLIVISDSGKERFKKLPKKYKSISISKEMLQSNNEMNDLKYSLQQNLSSPLLGSNKIVKCCQEKHLRKGPYTENSLSFVYSKYMKPISVRSYEHDTNLKIF